MQIFSMKDKTSDAFMQPFFAAHAAVAMRTMGDVAADPQTMLSKHPQDFAIYRVGYFEPSTGVIHPEPQPMFITDIESLIRRKTENEKA